VYGTSLTRSLTVIGSLTCFLVVGTPARAEPGPARASAPLDDVQAQAQARFEQALQAHQQGRFRAAIEHFKEADRLAPSARISFNIAKVYDRVDDAPNALAAYREYLRRLPAAENEPDTSLRIAELELILQRSGVQQVSVLSSPAGAAVVIDGVSRGVTPWTGELPPGTHDLALRLDEHLDVERDFELPARHAIDLLVQLEPVPTPAPAPAAAPVRIRATAPPPPPERSAAPDQPSYVEAGPAPSWWTWTLFGSSAALLASSGIVELSRQNLESDIASSDDPQVIVPDRYEAMQARTTASRVLLGMGLVAGALGGVSLYLDLSQPRVGDPALALGCDTGACGAFARGLW
jgi:tetratricopeptide (TPR) repeat protein